jgi:hypothetical protein
MIKIQQKISGSWRAPPPAPSASWRYAPTSARPASKAATSSTPPPDSPSTNPGYPPPLDPKPSEHRPEQSRICGASLSGRPTRRQRRPKRQRGRGETHSRIAPSRCLRVRLTSCGLMADKVVTCARSGSGS